MAAKVKKIVVRAGHGTIRVRQRAKPYFAEIMVAGSRLTQSFATEEEAQDWLLDLCRRTFKYGITTDKSKVTFKQVVELFLEAKELEGRKKTTLQDYRNCLKYCEAWNDLPIQHLTPQHITKILAQMKQGMNGHKPLGPKTLRNNHGTLHALLAFAESMDIVDRNVCDKVKPPAVPEKMPTVIPAPKIAAFLKALEGEPLEAFYWMILATGLRKGEAIGLKWADIDLETGVMTIQRRIARLRGSVDIDTPKSKAGLRVVQLPSKALEKLKAWKVQQQVQKAVSTNWVEGDWVFTHSSGKWVEPRWVNKKLTEVLIKAQLEHVTVHQLRHSFATLLLSKGVPIKDVQEILGHAKASTTLNLYYSAIPGASARVSAKVDELLG